MNLPTKKLTLAAFALVASTGIAVAQINNDPTDAYQSVTLIATPAQVTIVLYTRPGSDLVMTRSQCGALLAETSALDAQWSAKTGMPWASACVPVSLMPLVYMSPTIGSSSSGEYHVLSSVALKSVVTSSIMLMR